MDSERPASSHLEVVYRATTALTPYANNARKHSKKQIAKIVRSLKRLGWTNPILIDAKLGIICGHGRYQAALELGMETVPTIMLHLMSEADRRAYIIADNKIAEEAEWSRSTLRTELSGLIDLGYPVELTGFDTVEIDTILSFDDRDGGKEDNVTLPSEAAEPVSRLGDCWIIGKHRLVIGDARDPQVYDLLLDGEMVGLILTDPPYGCVIENNVSGNGETKHRNFAMGAGEVGLQEYAMTLLRPAFKCMAIHCRSGAIAFVFIDWRASPYMLDAASGVFLEVKNLIVWVKTNAGQGAFYRSAHELVYAFKVSAGKHVNNFGMGGRGRYRTNVWTYAGANVFRAGRMADLKDHPTVKPKKLLGDAILDCSNVNDIVLDPFAGSGSTLCACAETGRRGRGIEIDPIYGDVILRRLQKETGEIAMRGERTFTEIAAERLGKLETRQ